MLVARGTAGRRAHTEASSLTRLVETLVYDFPTEQELTRAARMLAADAAGRELGIDDLRATFTRAWRRCLEP